MGYVSGVEISTVIRCSDRGGIEILEELKVSFSGICASIHDSFP
jgi:hypothetical protein